MYILLAQRDQRQSSESSNDNACAIENPGNNVPKSDRFTMLSQDWKQQFANANNASDINKLKEHAHYHLSAIRIDLT